MTATESDISVVHVSLFDRRGGACIAAYRQHEALQRSGVSSRIWARCKETADAHVMDYQPTTEWHARIFRFGRRLLLKRQLQRADPHGEFFDERSDLAAELPSAMPDADLYNLHFSQGFLDHSAFLESLPAAKPVVFTLHEMSWFTGGCSYAGDCRRFEEGCGMCPLLRRSAPNDFSRRGWLRRQELYRLAPRLHFVANSQWTADQARASSLLQDLPVSVIHLGVDTTRFRPMDQALSRQVLGMPVDVPVIAFAAASVSDERKGMRHLLEALGSIQTEAFLLTWGRNCPVVNNRGRHFHLGNLENEYLTALAYNAADVFVMPSLEETFGQTALEAVACGVPVVAFDVGGIPDTVKPDLNGYLVPCGESRALASGIEAVLRDQAFRDRWRSQAREWTEQNFSYEKNAREYINLYIQMLGKAS